MGRCLELAALGVPYASPNPLVGCVIVHENAVIGEGYHSKFRDSHAEVMAINSVENKALLKNSTLYVNLEPCNHYGMTPPCVDLVLTNNIPRLVCAMKDPNTSVAGEGLKHLKQSGVDVIEGILEKEARTLNKSFICFHTQNRPFIILKWARTSDGFIGRSAEHMRMPRQISGSMANIWVHKLRAASSAIVVGRVTINEDNPSLTTRLHPGPNPMRVVLDPNGRTKPKAVVYTDGHPTTIFTHQQPITNAQVVTLHENENILKAVFKWAVEHNHIQLLVEGGAITLNRFIASDLWDEAIEIVSPVEWGDGVKSPVLEQSPNFTFHLGKDVVHRYIHKGV